MERQQATLRALMSTHTEKLARLKQQDRLYVPVALVLARITSGSAKALVDSQVVAVAAGSVVYFELKHLSDFWMADLPSLLQL